MDDDETPLDLLEPSPFVEPERAPIYREEPIAIAEALKLADSEHPRAIWRGIDTPTDATHPFGGFCKVCSEAGRETKLDQLWRQIDPVLAPGWFAVNCCDSCYEDAKRDTATLEKQREWWLSKCPVEFRDEWDQRKGNGKLLSRVMQFKMDGGKGLVIHGPTETGKTRAVWRLLKNLTEQGVEWLFIEAIDLLDNIPDRAFNVPLLIIDDLGNDALTGPKEVRLLKLLRYRCNWHKPFIVTTQFNGDMLTKRFSETATAQAVIRRLRGFCDNVSAKPMEFA